MSQKTSLHRINKEKYQAKFVNFNGWEMPIRYSSIVKEHLAVRNRVGIFDVSHMGNFIVTGKDSYLSMNQMISNDLGKISPGQAIYTPLLYENGTFVDDIILYYHSPDRFNIVVNAANINKDYKWIQENIGKWSLEANLKNVSTEICLLAIQGKESSSIISEIFPKHDQNQAFHFSLTTYQGCEVMVSNTGYTGEPGVEIWCPNQVAPKLFTKAVELGALPCGLGARDSLRLEKGYSLYGHEITDETNAWEAGLSWTVALSKDYFIGKTALEKIKTEGVKRKLVGLVMDDKAIPRSGCSLYDFTDENRIRIGEVTSGGYSPFLEKNIALAYLPKSYTAKEVFVEIRNQLYSATLHKRVFC